MQHYLRPDLLEAAGIDRLRHLGRHLRPDRHPGRDGPRRRRQLPAEDPVRQVPQRAGNAPHVARLRRHQDRRGPQAARPRPGPAPADGQRAPETVVVQPSDELIDYHGRTRRAGRGHPQPARSSPEEDNMLKVCGDGRNAALDLRLVGLPQTAPGKIERRRRPDRRHLATRTATTSTSRPTAAIPGPRAACSWCSATSARRRPTGTSTTNCATSSPPAACPAASIRFVHEAKTDRDKGELFAACRAGSVAVLVGSTEKMGVGTNVQDRAIALHHLDCPWRPADVAQREGRILRQGNRNRARSRSSATSPNAPSTPTCGRPSNAKPGSSPRSCAAASTSARSTTSATPPCPTTKSRPWPPATRCCMDKAEADAELTRLERAERAHHRNQDALRHTITQAEPAHHRPHRAHRRHRHRHHPPPRHPRRRLHHDRRRHHLQQAGRRRPAPPADHRPDGRRPPEIRAPPPRSNGPANSAASPSPSPSNASWAP